MINRARQQDDTTAIETPKLDVRGYFDIPCAYQNGSRKRLKAFHNGDWWLNVDYVTSEVSTPKS